LERAVGARIEAVERRGKFLLLPLARAGEIHDELVIHLGMTGALSPTPPESHERVRLLLDGPPPAALHFKDPRRFGRFLVVPRGDHRTLPTLAAMGPEPLGDGFTLAAFTARLASVVAIKTLLLSQRPVSGVGNIYADEALWRARIHPLTPATDLTPEQVSALHAAIRAVLATAVAHQGTTLRDYRTVNGAVGAYAAQLDAYGHAGDPCRRCGGVIERLVVGARGTHVCPRCQPRPDGAKVPARPRARR
jgi:formamidopyrimidine-DNA glycosylase